MAGSAVAVNGASFAPGPLAPGSIFSLFVPDLGVAEALAGSLPLPRSLGRVAVTIGGLEAPLYFAGPRQINAQVPFEIPPGPAEIIVKVDGAQRAIGRLEIAATSPGVFLLPGPGNRAVVQNGDRSLNGPNNPASSGSVIVSYLTGQGAVDNAVRTGEAAVAEPLSRTAAEVRATIGGQPAEVFFAGLTPGLVGLLQANLRVPDGVIGDAQLVITIGGIASNPAVVSVIASRP